MTNFKQYFRAHIKAKIKPIIYILTSVLIFTWLLGNTYQQSTIYNNELNQTEINYKSMLYLPVVFMCILAYIIPVMEFSFFKKRINLDCAYSMPISRKAMGAIHYLVGLLILWCSFTLSYLTNAALLLSRGPGWFDFAPMIEHYFLCFALGTAIYSMMVFIFNEANTRGDGIWFMLLNTFIVNIVLNAIAYITDIEFKYALGSLPWHIFTKIDIEYQSLVELRTADRSAFWGSDASIIWFVFWILIGIASAVAFFLTFGKRRMEKVEECSDSYFGFCTLIPLYAISAMIIFNASNNIIWWVVIEALTFIGYTIYRRGFHYKKSDIAILCMMFIFLFL